MRSLWIIDKVSETVVPQKLGENQQILPLKLVGQPGFSYDVIITYEHDSERQFGGSCIKFSKGENYTWITSTLDKNDLFDFISRHWGYHALKEII